MRSRRLLSGKKADAFGAVIIFLCCSTGVFADGHKTIVLDPGHSAGSRGTQSCSGRSEYLFNEELVQSIAGSLRRRQTIVLETRVSGEYLNNHQRAAKYPNADLFVSIHHDSAQPQYIKNVKTSQGVGYCSDKFHGFSLFVSAQNRQYERSLFFAKKLADALLARGYRPTPHHAEDIPGERRKLLDPTRGIYQRDDLTVLKENSLPAVLFEAGVIINPEDERLVRTPKFREDVAESFLELLR